MMFIFYSIPCWFYYNFVEYLLHTLSHSYNYGTYIYKLHKKHHTIHYPITKLMSISPYKTNYYLYILSDGTIAHGLPVLGIIYLNYKLLNYEIFINISCWLIINAYFSDYLHTEIHTQNSWLEKYEWFQKKRDLHLIHHKKTSKNINMMCSFIDKIFNTYENNIIASSDSHNPNN